MIFIDKIKYSLERHPQRYLWGSIASFILIFSFLVLRKYYYFGYNIADLAIFSQTLFNTLHGRWFEETITLNNYFADHFSPILFLLLPLYAMWQSAQALLLIQVVVTALCAWPIFAIAKKYSNNRLFALGASLSWLLNPFVHKQVMYEFHLLHLMVFLFFWSFYFYQNKRVAWFILFSILTIFTREDSVFLFFGLSLFSLFDKRSKKITLSIFLFALLYFVAAIFFIRHISLSDSYKFTIYYDWLGGDDFVSIIFSWLKNPIGVLGHIFTIKNIFIVFYFFLPFLFIPFFSRKYLLLSLFPFLQLIMTGGGLNNVKIYSHYSMILLPGVYLAYIFGAWAIITRRIGVRWGVLYNNKLFFIILFIFSCAFFLIFVSPITKMVNNKFLPNHHELRNNIIKLIPAEASVCAESSLMAPISSRTKLYNIDYVYYGKSVFAERDFKLPQVDYIFLDMTQFLATLNARYGGYLIKRGDPASMPDRWASTLSDYTLVYAENNIFLWQNKQNSSGLDLPYFELEPIDENNNSIIKKWSVTEGVSNNVLNISYNKLKSNNYLVRFYQGEQYWELPFDYGLYSFKQKKAGQTASVYYYLNDQVDSFEIYQYEGLNTLGDFGNLDFLFKRQSVFNKTALTD